MLHFGHCPRCAQEVSSDRMIGGSVVCHCGWTMSQVGINQSANLVDRSISKMIISAAVLVGLFIHLINWDKHSLSITHLKLKQWANLASTSELEQVADICLELKKYSCTESAWAQIARHEPKNLTNLARLGKLFYQRGEHRFAATYLSDYVAARGQEVEPLYFYAQSLVSLKKFSEAETVFKTALKQKPEIFQISVARAYIKLLMDSGRTDDAKRMILHYRKQSETASLFMEKELSHLRGEATIHRNTASIR